MAPGDATATVTTVQSPHVAPFVPETITRERWFQRFIIALGIMKITEEEDKKNYLLTFVGDVGYNALWDNFGAEFAGKSYTQMVDKLKALVRTSTFGNC